MKQSKWKREKPWTGLIHQGCLNCPPVEDTAPMDMVIGVGFGYAAVTKDGKEMWREDHETEFDDLPELRQVETVAMRDPDHDWRVILEAPLRSREYQRQGYCHWVLIKSGMGFA